MPAPHLPLLLAVAAPPELAGGGYGAYLLRTVVVLAFVCALAWIVLRLLLRRFAMPGRRATTSQRAVLRVVARLPLDPRRAVYLIEAPGKALLVGVSETGPMTTLAELDPQLVATTAPSREKSFLEILARRRESAPIAVASFRESSSDATDSSPPEARGR